MERVAIETSVAEIPISPLGKVARDHEVWEGTDGDARFKVTRHQLLEVPSAPEMLYLSVSGESSERGRIISEFSAVYGKPVGNDTSPEDPLYIDSAWWLFARKV
jgi:hypothetical protein